MTWNSTVLGSPKATQAVPPPGDPKTKLAAILKHARLITPPAVALRVVDAASDDECTPKEIADLLAQDPVLCGKVLKAVNSCVFSTGTQPIATVERAVIQLGMNPLRSLVLGLSLPVIQSRSATTKTNRDFWISSVSGGILARELSAVRGKSSPGYDLVAGLLRDLGMLLLTQANPAAWDAMCKMPVIDVIANRLAVEERLFGVNHAEVSAELLTEWKLPPDVVEPIRHHHQPDKATARPSWAERAELLSFVEMLTSLDHVAESPKMLAEMLAKASSRFDLSKKHLIAFLEGVAPKIRAFTSLLDVEVHESPDFAAVLTRGSEALVDLALSNQFRQSVAHVSIRDAAADPVGQPAEAAPASGRFPGLNLPAFSLDFLAGLPPEGCQLQQYHVKQILGRGAMGVVFGGVDPALGREVAIKIMSPEFAANPEARLRFTREAQALAAIAHENVVGVFAVGTAEGMPFIVMELVRGGSVEDRVERDGPLPVQWVVEYGGQMALGLAAAHAKGIVHRDIKPSNILIEEATNRVKVSDFGLARATTNFGITQAGALVGSPLFMSPEQIDGLPLDGRSDLFSLGAVLYNMCTGHLPFQAAGMGTLMRLISEARPFPPIAHRPELPLWLNEVVLDLLKKRPADRIPTAEKLYARLKAGRR